MLEANDFNAVRISLASPDQIRSWSYGEVTKPETINYRTLKPEKDGLFCEKIFGPTKDFECYCGKYKRIRYKGIICDRCGVEVARSKVRRERMGHIELASPVSHIWFVRGTPSRLGLLLDLSPRNLEQVLYFVKFIITDVDEVEREAAIQRIQEEHSQEITKLEQAVTDKIGEIEQRLEEEISQVETEKETENRRIEEELSAAVAVVMSEATDIEAKLSRGIGTEAAEEVLFNGVTIVVKGMPTAQSHLTALHEEVQKKIEEIKANLDRIRQEKIESINVEADHLRRVTISQIGQLHRELTEEREQLEEKLRARIAELEGLRPMTLIPESKHRELKERYENIFKAGMGAEAILNILNHLDLDKLRDKLYQEIHSSSGQRRKKATKRLRVIEALRKSGNKPEWMLLPVIPVLPPDLRPMVQLDGGRFATSDLNDLYRRVINRNNRLRRLLELRAPEIIIRNEKRMLQEAVDSLIDNGRRGKPVTTSRNHKLKPLSDMLRGKQGRFRQNLLGKRVDYSGRSVIIAGPELKLHQCGLPKRMALELFKPFVMQRLVAQGLAHNIKSAKRIVERVKPEVWDILEELVKDRFVLLNRAPTLHRLSIQAFKPILVDGNAIQMHPLVCAAFNADFDGDQIAVHVPLSKAAIEEARQVMLSTYNMLSPSSGEPLVAPTLDMVLGCYYMTIFKPGAKGEGILFASFDEAKLAYQLGIIELQAEIEVRNREKEKRLKTSVGRIILNDVLPQELGFRNQVMDKDALKQIVADCHKLLGNETTAVTVDSIKKLGFQYATKSGITIAINDIEVPESKTRVLEAADQKIAEIEKQFRRGLITEDERYNSAVAIWTQATDEITATIEQSLPHYGSIYLMAVSGAKGNIAQIRQMAGMRGLMTDPSGRIIDLPIRSSFREGLTALEYFISTHGARKGLADTALRTADAGYLTRRLIDVAQDMIVLEDDCGTSGGIWLSEPEDKSILAPLSECIIGRIAAASVVHPETGELIVDRNEGIDESKANEISSAGITRVYVRSPLSCQSKRGMCRLCYGQSPARGRLVNKGEAVGIIAAQSIGEPGTQLTLRTFHTGGVVGVDITSGLPRVEELFEARSPKRQAILSEMEGRVEILDTKGERRIRVSSSELYRDEYSLPPGYQLVVETGEWVDAGTVLAQPTSVAEAEQTTVETTPVLTRIGGRMEIEDDQVFVLYEEKEEREYPVPAAARILVENGALVKAGDQLTEGARDPQDILRIQGREDVQKYLLDEVQKVYRAQGVNINDKHIEVIIRQMLRKVRIDSLGDTTMLPGELVDQFVYEDTNAKVLAEGGEPATAQTVLLGITKASLSTDSFLSAASFQETTRILTEAALAGSTDRLLGLKENVIIGKLIPARCEISMPEEKDIEAQAELLANLAPVAAEI